MPRIRAVDPAVATGRAKDLLQSVHAMLGVIPNMARTMANQPAVLALYLGFGDALRTGAFDSRTRHAIALAAAGANGCEYCASAHVAASRKLGVDDQEIGRWLQGRSTDARLDAVLVFAREVIGRRGRVTDADLQAVRTAGHDDAAIVEIIANVAANLFTNYLNLAAQTEIDFPRVALSARRAA